MTFINNIIEKIIEIGPVIIIPSILLVFGLIASRKPLSVLKNSTFIFIGLVGLSILLSLFINFFEPLINTILTNSSKEFEIIDIGWLVSEKVILNSPINLQIIIAIIALNIFMLLFRLTRTINIDLWNYWIFLLVGSIVFTITGIAWIGILIAAIVAAISLVLADIYAIYISSYFGIKGVSNPQAQVISWAPISHFINFIFNKIPFIKKIHFFYEEIQQKLGYFSEPMIVGFILGFAIGLITKYKNFYLNINQNLIYALTSGLKLSIIMILMPRVVRLLIKSLNTIINDIRSFINKRITKREIYIGLNSIFFSGYPSVIGLSVIIIPLSVYIATLLPGNTVLPSADLIMIPFILVWAIAPSRGDIFRSFISAMIIIPILIWLTGDMGTLFTNYFTKYNFEIVEGYKGISSIGSSSNLIFWILFQLVKPIFSIFT